MTPQPDSPSPADRSPRGPDPLDELGQRVRAAQEAAERILAEATEAAGRAQEQPAAERPPPSGYAGPPPRSNDRPGAEAQAVSALIDLGRGLFPAELRRAIAELVRELLLLLRALIDWYLERIDLRRREPAEVQDIPIT